MCAVARHGNVETVDLAIVGKSGNTADARSAIPPRRRAYRIQTAHKGQWVTAQRDKRSQARQSTVQQVDTHWRAAQ